MLQKFKHQNKTNPDNCEEYIPPFSDNITNNNKIKRFNEGIIIIAIFSLFSIFWLLASSNLLFSLTHTMEQYHYLLTVFSCLYILLAGPIIYYLIRKRTSFINRILSELQVTNTYLCDSNSKLIISEGELQKQQRNNEKIFLEAHVVIATWNKEGCLKRLNPYGQQLFGYSESELIDRNWSSILLPKNSAYNVHEFFEKIKQGTQEINRESIFITKDGRQLSMIWNNSLLEFHSRPDEILSIGTDISDRKFLEDKLKGIAYYDELTSLPNRLLLENEMNSYMAQNIPFTLAHLNFDNLRQINDSLGPAIADEFLKFIANKLSCTIQSPDVTARLGGDQFAVLFKKPRSNEEIEKIIALCIRNIGNSWEYKQSEFFISLRVGISSYPSDGLSSNTIFRNASIAMYKAKNDRKGRILFYSDEILNENLEKIFLSNQLQYALKYQQLTLYYQPQFNISTGFITGMEALVRWIHPEKGFIPPDKFIPLAEETGQIYEIEKWIIETALKQKKQFEEEGNYDISISINLSSKSLSNETVFHGLVQLLDSYDVDYSHITIEITETAILSGINYAVQRLKTLRKMGIKIALDDFGTGYSSLIHLKDLPIDIIKLDQSFIKNIEETSKAAMIIKAILYLTLDLNYEVVAEGIETQEQLDYLRKHNCQTGQGFLISHPLPIEKFEAFMNIDD